MACLIQSVLFTRRFSSSQSLIMDLNWATKFFETRTRPYATATAGCYCELQHFPQSLQSSQMLSVSSARLCLYIVCVNCLIPSLLPVFLSLSRWHPPPRCPPVTETRRPWIFSDRDSISPRCEAALRPGAPQKPTHTRTHPGAEHLGPVSAGHPQDPSGQSGDLLVHSGRAGPGSRSAGLPASPSVWGRKSRRALAGAAVPRATHPLPRTVGTRFNWQNSTGQSVASLPKKDKLSQPFSSFFFWTGFCWSAFRCGTFTKPPSQCFTRRKALLFFIKECFVDKIRAKLLSPSPLKSGKVQKRQMLLSKNKRFIFTFILHSTNVEKSRYGYTLFFYIL